MRIAAVTIGLVTVTLLEERTSLSFSASKSAFAIWSSPLTMSILAPVIADRTFSMGIPKAPASMLALASASTSR